MAGTQHPPLSFFKRKVICPRRPATSDGGAAETGARLSAMLRSVSDGVHGAVLSDSSKDRSGLSRRQGGIKAFSRRRIAAAHGCIYLMEWEPACAVRQCLADGTKLM